MLAVQPSRKGRRGQRKGRRRVTSRKGGKEHLTFHLLHTLGSEEKITYHPNRKKFGSVETTPDPHVSSANVNAKSEFHPAKSTCRVRISMRNPFLTRRNARVECGYQCEIRFQMYPLYVREQKNGAFGKPCLCPREVASWGLSSKTLVLLVRTQILHFRRFRQKSLRGANDP